MFTHDREIIDAEYERHRAGTNVMLVADFNKAPVGQIWIDLEKKATERIGVLWALRVFPWFQKMRIGTRLLEAAERVLRQRGYRTAELSVAKNNLRAKRLYERKGYRAVKEQNEPITYTNPGGEQVQIVLDQWLMRKQIVGSMEEGAS